MNLFQICGKINTLDRYAEIHVCGVHKGSSAGILYTKRLVNYPLNKKIEYELFLWSSVTNFASVKWIT